MERVNIYCDTPDITAAHLVEYLPKPTRGAARTLRDATEAFEREFIQTALDECDGGMTEAARRLGLERSHLYKKMKKLGLLK
jgi:DNA-binding NtrC family response regulator